MSIFEYLATMVAIVLGLAVANLLKAFSKTIITINWRGLGWFLSLWCTILLLVLLGFFWAFWRLYSESSEISIWEFICVPFFLVICFFLSTEFLPVPEKSEDKIDPYKYFIEARKPFFITLFLFWAHLTTVPSFIGYEQPILEIYFGWLMVILSFSGILLTTIRAHKILVLLWSAGFLSQEALQIAIGL